MRQPPAIDRDRRPWKTACICLQCCKLNLLIEIAMARAGPCPHSCANYHEAVTASIHLELALDFQTRQCRGFCELALRILADGIDAVYLDSNSLIIDCVRDISSLVDESTVSTAETFSSLPVDAPADAGSLVAWTLPEHSLIFGHALRVPVPAQLRRSGATFRIRIHYATSARSTGIQWLGAKQTAGGDYPFCYTQGQAILARTLLPCQDTPAVKAPFSARISCAAPLVAVCSGLSTTGNVPLISDGGQSLTYSWLQSNAIPTYLITIACGALHRAPVGPRSSVWAEKCMIAASQAEFSEDTEKFIAAGELVTGVSYDWGTWDMVLLPSSFPYGGMENPNCCFLSASLLAGDRSLTNVVAHEITHSWAGNYVTNSNWADFWYVHNRGDCKFWCDVCNLLVAPSSFDIFPYVFFTELARVCANAG
jgi:leukotriene-A4 hydrolase